MTNTGATPTQTGSTPTQQQLAEQAAAADSHERAEAKQRLTFGLADTLLPLMNQQVTVAGLRYYLGLAIDQVLGSEDGIRLQQPQA